ncbi:hypothetical protein BC792_10273 [Sphingobacterium allocomposti]|uniref:Uncharacterized protein n=1 Tax=Sphingobacterium allocomposti TaxID=415956 RepID=A0A5S5DP51_9SPHI|nr:hypothetical protein BC792_10273 [Sphingobacterium composti Yoo et al. 2007 non Ten et al. 2007]
MKYSCLKDERNRLVDSSEIKRLTVHVTVNKQYLTISCNL